LSLWESSSHFEFTIGGSKLTSSGKFGRGELVSSIVFSSGDDVQFTICSVDVLTSVSVVLEFVVSESSISDINVPFSSVETVELVAPGLDPVLSGDGGETNQSTEETYHCS